MDTSLWVAVVIFAIAGLGFPILNMTATAVLKPNYPDPEKLEPYESGEVPVGDARIRFRVNYYIFALIFLVFDVETVFLYPWAVQFKQLGLFGLVEMVIFIALLAIGLIYAYKKKVLRWL